MFEIEDQCGKVKEFWRWHVHKREVFNIKVGVYFIYTFSGLKLSIFSFDQIRRF